MSDKQIKAIKVFVDDIDENIYAFEIKSSDKKKVVICIAETFDFTIHCTSGGDIKGKYKITSSDDVLEDWVKEINKYCTQGKKTIIEILQKATQVYKDIIDVDDEEEDEEDYVDDEEEEDEDFYTSGDIFDGLEDPQAIVKKKKEKSYDPLQEKIEKRFKNKQKVVSKTAIDRLIKDYLQLKKQDTTKLGFLAEPKGDNLFDWDVKLFGFDKSTCKDFCKDLQTYKKKKGQDYILLNMKFPAEYPYKPPFIRVVCPRFKFHTGHVTVGGSICMELLTTSGWRPINTLEAVFIQIRLEMSTGGARLDLSNYNQYTEHEARAAFLRVARHHKWEK